MKIALVGYGVEGRASYNYFSKSGDNEFTVFDEFAERPADLPEKVEFVSGPTALDELRSRHFDKVLRTPPLAPSKLEGVENVTSGTREFFAHCSAPIIGVTGTKGKGTIASLIAEILGAAGKTVHLVGNIGKPALDVLNDVQADDIVVYELSSFQLWDLDRSPHIAVVSVIEPEHLDVHSNLNDYIEAKAHIRQYQTAEDVCFYHPTSGLTRKVVTHPVFNLDHAARYAVPDDGAVYVKENTFCVQEQQICSVDNLRLIGQHNVDNACAAISAALQYSDDFAAIERGLKNFKGLPHRIEFVREVGGVKYYDDSFSSAPPALKVAVASFEEPVILLAGGKDRHLSFNELAYDVATHSNIKAVLLFGETKQLIADALQAHNVENIEILADDLQQVVGRAHELAVAGDVVVLSPGCASFDMFKNFVERGEKFQEIVRNL